MRNLFTVLFVLLCSLPLLSQGFDMDEYQSFLNMMKTADADKMIDTYPPGLYSEKTQFNGTIDYLDSLKQKYDLTEDELELLYRQNFMVTERLSYPSFWAALEEIYHKDLPVYISSDLILHALHKSYDEILIDFEQYYIIDKYEDALEKMRADLPQVLQNNLNSEIIKTSVLDVDLYLTVAYKLLTDNDVDPLYSDNQEDYDKLMDYIEQLSMVQLPLFSKNPRMYDFSQLTPRGHYTDVARMSRYFKSMMWLGRTEFYLTSPKAIDNIQKLEDLQRQILDAVIMTNIAESSGAGENFAKINEIIKSLVGESDNVTMDNMNELMQEANIKDYSDLESMEKVKEFQNILLTKEYAEQKIVSQLLYTDPNANLKTKPASAFLLMGQRFIIDSYVFSNVVFDRVKPYKMNYRALPKANDILFALGNNAAGDFLYSDYEKFNYQSNLAACRYLIDSYDESFWNKSFYNNWLYAIKTLNPPENILESNLPEFMKTPAWWQHKMSSQLAAWSQLRHDNLLYAKQSYTGGVTCSFPEVYLEPVPDFYLAVNQLAKNAIDMLTPLQDEVSYAAAAISYFSTLETTTNKLYTISQKFTVNEALTEEETTYLKSIFDTNEAGCAIELDGWFARMFYRSPDTAGESDYVVADVHTSNIDFKGNDGVGWVYHVGTGDVNMAVIFARTASGNMTAFAGPVLSFYEYVSGGFKRHTDQEWEETILSQATRPEFTDIYLADNDGKATLVNYPMLPVGINENHSTPSILSNIKISITPNPVSEKTHIAFRVPDKLSITEVAAEIYALDGTLIYSIHNGTLQSGSYVFDWDATNSNGIKVTSGKYLLNITIAGQIFSETITVVK